MASFRIVALALLSSIMPCSSFVFGRSRGLQVDALCPQPLRQPQQLGPSDSSSRRPGDGVAPGAPASLALVGVSALGAMLLAAQVRPSRSRQARRSSTRSPHRPSTLKAALPSRSSWGAGADLELCMEEDITAPHVQMGVTPVVEAARKPAAASSLGLDTAWDSVVFVAYVISGIALVLIAAQLFAGSVLPGLELEHHNPMPFLMAWLLLRRRFKRA